MAKNVSTYAPSTVACLILGIEIGGFDNDSFITITPTNERVTYRETPDGKVTAFIKRNQVYEVEIKLAKTSPSNAYLQILHNIYLEYGQLFKMPIYIKGGSGKSSFYAADSFIKIEPTSVHSSSPVSNTWRFVCFNATYTEVGVDADDEFFTEIAGAVGLASEVMNMLGVNPTQIIDKVSEVANRTGIASKISEKIKGFFG